MYYILVFCWWCLLFCCLSREHWEVIGPFAARASCKVCYKNNHSGLGLGNICGGQSGGSRGHCGVLGEWWPGPTWCQWSWREENGLRVLVDAGWWETAHCGQAGPRHCLSRDLWTRPPLGEISPPFWTHYISLLTSLLVMCIVSLVLLFFLHTWCPVIEDINSCLICCKCFSQLVGFLVICVWLCFWCFYAAYTLEILLHLSFWNLNYRHHRRL